jgi:heat shock protein HslJ
MKIQSKSIHLHHVAESRAPRNARWAVMILILGLVLSACAPAATPAQPPPAATAQPSSAVSLASGETPLTETIWYLQSYGDPKNPTPIEAGTSIDALFSPAKSLSGFSGCNTYTARYAIQGNTIRFDQPIATYKSCPQGMEQEGVYLSALVSATTYEITGSTLEITYNKGNGLLTYTASAQPAESGSPAATAAP